MTSVNLLHVSAPGCHPQGLFQIKREAFDLKDCFSLSERFPDDDITVPKHAGD
jgi:hypothetical protein